MKLFPYVCPQCTYDECVASSVRERITGQAFTKMIIGSSGLEVKTGIPGTKKRARQVHHRLGQARWWHWSDQAVVNPGSASGS